MLFSVTFLLPSVNLTPPYIESAHRSANLSILEILGCNTYPTMGKGKAIPLTDRGGP
jgi:hypothetical protein